MNEKLRAILIALIRMSCRQWELGDGESCWVKVNAKPKSLPHPQTGEYNVYDAEVWCSDRLIGKYNGAANEITEEFGFFRLQDCTMALSFHTFTYDTIFQTDQFDVYDWHQVPRP